MATDTPLAPDRSSRTACGTARPTVRTGEATASAEVAVTSMAQIIFPGEPMDLPNYLQTWPRVQIAIHLSGCESPMRPPILTARTRNSLWQAGSAAFPTGGWTSSREAWHERPVHRVRRGLNIFRDLASRVQINPSVRSRRTLVREAGSADRRFSHGRQVPEGRP